MGKLFDPWGTTECKRWTESFGDPPFRRTNIVIGGYGVYKSAVMSSVENVSLKSHGTYLFIVMTFKILKK